MSERAQQVRLAGRTLSQGLVVGRAFIYRERLKWIAGAHEIEEHQVEEELGRIDQALEKVVEDLCVSVRLIEGEAGGNLATIFEAHEAMLQDPALRQELQEAVRGDLISAAHALSRGFRRWERKFRTMCEETHRQHATDVADLRQRLLREIAGVQTISLEKMPPGRVLAARRLLPSDTVALPRQAAAAIIVECGVPGSHAALLVEALGIPTVAQIPHAARQIAEDELLIVDGFNGEVVVSPNPATLARYSEEVQRLQAQSVHAFRLADQPARTLSVPPPLVPAVKEAVRSVAL